MRSDLDPRDPKRPKRPPGTPAPPPVPAAIGGGGPGRLLPADGMGRAMAAAFGRSPDEPAYVPRFEFDAEAADAASRDADPYAWAVDGPVPTPRLLTDAGRAEAEREGRRRPALLGLLSTVPALAGLVAGPSSALGSALLGVAQGTAAGSMRLDAEQREALERRSAAAMSVFERDRSTADAARRDFLQNDRADKRQTAADAAADAREAARVAAQAERDQFDAVQAQARAAIENGDVESYVRIAVDRFDMDEETARGIAEAAAARIGRADLVEDRNYGVRARGVAATEASGALGWARFRADRDDEAYDRAHPPARSGGPRPAAPAAPGSTTAAAPRPSNPAGRGAGPLRVPSALDNPLGADFRATAQDVADAEAAYARGSLSAQEYVEITGRPAPRR